MTGALVDRLDPGALLDGFTAGRDDVGGVVSFTGYVRRDGDVEALELEAYPALTEAEIARVAAEVRARHDLIDLLVRHRTGRMAPGEPVVFVAAAAAHRRAAFEAADQMMDWLKSRAPFWKKEHAADGSRWIEPRSQDYDDAARWDAPAPPQEPAR
ncbi:MAG: molybdenum cofactor biosynthesis protein MoaE [Caulobacteraceae bacterium]|nr:molybdenum cofactor biosynthesis protein MoaE [Caulobacter sp.]